ncbi:MAG: hypothetical protein IT323_19265 [Anaerolineae bacterium]|nr:hypothetical protein [Anaerolineae bacterium]
MARRSNGLDVYLEIGKKKTFACAVEWPGWCRSGRDEAGALQALRDSGPRYAQALRAAGLDFRAPDDEAAFTVAQRLPGNATTDFGAPGIVPDFDSRPVDEAELARLQTILKACWAALDAAVAHAQGKTLRTGPRGGGRTAEEIVRHVRDAEAGYCSSMGGKIAKTATYDEARQVILEALAASARGEIAEYGPRGGKRWPARYFARRSAWHVLDHAWEIEDRAE